MAAFARQWRTDRQRDQQTTGRGTFDPLAFRPGEAFQFDWSEDFAVVGGERRKLQVAHIKLSHSRAFLLRAYPLQTHALSHRARTDGAAMASMFDAHWHAFRLPAEDIPGIVVAGGPRDCGSVTSDEGFGMSIYREGLT